MSRRVQSDASVSSAAGSTQGLAAWCTACGHFFFRHRNGLFPIVFGLGILSVRPSLLFGDRLWDRAVIYAGVVVALLGEGVRLLTIGYEYIERGGKNRRVYASRLVQGGVYAHTRNPMYVGNGLIAIGVTLATGSPVAYATFIPFFLFVYWSIVLAEEAYLTTAFGPTYASYCRRVPRFIPSLRGLRRTLSAIRFDWRRAVRKELSTLAGLALGLLALPLWRSYFLDGWDAAVARAPGMFAVLGGVLACYGVAVLMKRNRWVFYHSDG